MTCIVGIMQDGKVYMGGDGAASYGGDQIVSRSEPKVFSVGEMLFGFTSSFRMGQILQYTFVPPSRLEYQTDMQYLIQSVVPTIQSTFESQRWLTTENGKCLGGVFLMGYRGTLYVIEEDFQIYSPYDKYTAIGCGYAHAMGSLASTDNQNPMERIQKALKITAKYNAFVSEPFTYIDL